MENKKAINLTKEQLQKAMACGTPEELMALAKENGYELTKDEAEAYMAELAVVDLSEEDMEAVAGGGPYTCSNLCNDLCLEDK